MLAIEPVHVNVNHLKKAVRNGGGRSLQVRKRIKPRDFAFLLVQHRIVHDSLCQLRLAQEIVIANRHYTHLRIGFHILDIRLNDWGVLPDYGDFIMLARNNTIDGLVRRGYRATGRSASLQWSAIGCLRLRSSGARENTRRDDRNGKSVQCVHGFPSGKPLTCRWT